MRGPAEYGSLGEPPVSTESGQELVCPTTMQLLSGACLASVWPAAGFKDTELSVSMKPEVRHGAYKTTVNLHVPLSGISAP